MEKLELKHLAPYLPYGLKYRQYGNYPIKKGQDNLLEHFGDVSLENAQNIIDDYNKKPILRPLSDLVKEITVNGETFMPVEKLFELNHPAHKSEKYYYTVVPNWIECSHFSTAVQFRFYLNDYFGNNYTTVCKLIEWHFDVFGLIEKGLAVSLTDALASQKL